ncbi:hypothetical protein MMC07_009200 [Pseudocyphellaria aurata]|nr:hypothetical protein [Pseudocyphellaria aurata]
MAPRAQWPVMNATVTSQATTSQEHSNELLIHMRALRHHITDTNSKTLPRLKFFEVYDSFEALTSKLLAGPEFEKVETRLRDEIHTMHNDLSKRLTAGHALTVGNCQQKGIPKVETSTDLSLVVKHVAPSIAEQLLRQPPKQVIKQINTTIKSISTISKTPIHTTPSLETSALPDQLWEERVVAFKLMRSGDALLSLRKEEDKELLSQHPHWTAFFGLNAQVQAETFGVIMHSVRINDSNLTDNIRRLQASEALVAANVSCIPVLAGERVAYIGWLKKTILPGTHGQTSAVVEFCSPEAANDAIHKGLV